MPSAAATIPSRGIQALGGQGRRDLNARAAAAEICAIRGQQWRDARFRRGPRSGIAEMRAHDNEQTGTCFVEQDCRRLEHLRWTDEKVAAASDDMRKALGVCSVSMYIDDEGTDARKWLATYMDRWQGRSNNNGSSKDRSTKLEEQIDLSMMHDQLSFQN